jgi:hypothetical protein
MSRITLIFAALVVLSSGFATTAAHAEDEIRYTVKQGETLLGIATDLMRKPAYWQRLQQINRIDDPYRLMPGTILRIPVALLRTEPVTATVTSVSGKVRANGQTLAAGDTVTGQTTIVTDEQSFVTINLIDGSRLVLQPESQLYIKELARYRGTEIPDTELRLERGRIESMITKGFTPRPKYRIEMPTATIGVRGTRFRVEADNVASRAEVTEGVIDVRADKTVAVTAITTGHGVVVADDGALSRPVALLPKPDLSSLIYLHERPIVRFTLPPLNGARSYRFQVGTDPAMHELLADAKSIEPEVKFGQLSDGEYILRVRGVDAQGLEGLDSDFRFRLKAHPEPPFASTPIGNLKVFAASPALIWTTSPEAARYHVQIASDEAFSRIVADIEDVEGNTIMPAHKLPLGDYLWRIRSIGANGDIGPWGDAQRFRMHALPAAVPSPTLSGDSMTFAWKSEPGQTFLFQLARDVAFTDIVSERQVAEPTITLPRLAPDIYYARTRATDADGFVGPYTTPQIVNVPYPPPSWWLLFMLLVPVFM